jgi:siroheme synthase
MSAAPLDELVGKLLHHGIAADKWLAVIEQATTPMQNVMSCPIHEYQSAGGGYISPTLIIIGKVVALHEAFRWLPDSNSQEPYFKPVPSSKLDSEARA